MGIIDEGINDGTLKCYLDLRSGSIIDLSGKNVGFSFAGKLNFCPEGLVMNQIVGAGSYLSSSDHTFDFDTTGSYSWVFTFRNSQSNGFMIILEKGAGSSGYRMLLGMVPTIAMKDYAVADGYTSNSNYTIGKIQTCVVTYSNRTLKIYINGVESALTKNNNGTDNWVSDAVNNLRIGAASASVKYVSVISAFAYFTKVLTATEVAQLTNELNNKKFKQVSTSKRKSLALVANTESNLVGYWKFKNEQGKVLDFSGNAYDGTITGCSSVLSEYGNSLLFANTTDSVVLPSNAALSTSLDTSGFTLIAIVYAHSFASSPSIWSYSGAATACNFFWYVSTAGVLTLQITDGSGNTNKTATTPLPLGKWCVVACAYNASTKNVDLYVDGVATSSVSATTLTSTLKAPTIGALSGATTRTWNGMIGEIALFNTPLNAGQITQITQNVGVATTFKTEGYAYESDAAVSAGFIENTPFEVGSGAFKISHSTVNSKSIKVIECVTAGVVYLKDKVSSSTSGAAFGSWEFWLSKAETTAPQVNFISIGSAGGAVIGNYALSIDSTEAVGLVERGVGDKFRSAAGYVAINTLIGFKITRTGEGLTTTYSKSSAQADWTLVTAATGSNPFTDVSGLVSSYIAIKLGIGDKIALGDDSGNYGFIKRDLVL